MASTSIWSVSNLKLGGNCLEPSGNDKNGGKDLVALCQPRGRCSHVHRLGNLITWEDHVLALLQNGYLFSYILFIINRYNNLHYYSTNYIANYFLVQNIKQLLFILGQVISNIILSIIFIIIEYNKGIKNEIWY